MFLTSPVFSVFDVAVDGGYIGTTMTDTLNNVAVSANGAGYIVNGAGHFNFGLPELLTFGVGPTISLGN